MKKIGILISLLIMSLSFTFGQTTNDSITMKKIFGGYQFYQGGERLNMSQLVNTMQMNEKAYKEIKSAQSTYTLGMIVGFAGGFMVGWPLGSALGGGKPDWTIAGIGAGLIAVSIPISRKFNRQAKKAVNSYNREFQTTSFWSKKELKLSMKGNGLGLVLIF